MGYGAIGSTLSEGYYKLHEDPDYPLPFKVEGWFDLTECELLDGSGVHGERVWVLKPDGSVATQSWD